MSYTVVRQEGFQLPSPPSTTPPAPDSLFMPPNLSFLPTDSFRKFPSAAQAHSHPTPAAPIDFTDDDLATLIDSHERTTYDPDPYRHNIFDISAPTSHYRPPSSTDIYPNTNDLHPHFNTTLPALNSTIRYEPHQDPPSHFAYRHTPSPHNPNSRSRSRSRAPSLGPTRTSRRDRRANSISSHVSGTSPPPPPPARPHAIVIPGRGGGSTMGGFFVPGQPEYSLPTPDSLSHSFGGFQGYNAATGSYAAQPASYASQNNVAVNYGSFGGRTGTPNMGISPSEVSTLGILASGATSPATAKGKHSDGDGLSEKRRRRRESHNAVERRRRDNINERIGELAGLIPGVLFECDALLHRAKTTTSSHCPYSQMQQTLTRVSLMFPKMACPPTPVNGSSVKKDPSEDGDDARGANGNANGGVNGGIPTNGITTANGSEPQMIKANKGMILRKSVEYIRYLQQLVSVQASRGRDLEERNRALERELATIRGTPLPSSRSASNSNSDSDSSRLSLASSQTSLPQSSSSWEGERKWEMDVEDRGEDEERGRGRARARKEDIGAAKIRDGDGDDGDESLERDMEI
ncbi:helix-loop-helix DNA-binding domain-containing protein [Suillus ampliporus]|nr:helix-loop-helix DNA-binding domain-containing protein [Suillus ampliporus]